MPAITSGKVLVTGANGYIAVWIVKSLLDAGFSVRGTVRSESKAGYLREHFKSFGDKLEIVVVEDITKEASFAEYVKDVDAIAHTASPFHMRAIEPEELITPAVEGTLSVLKAAAANGHAVKRVIVLSSTAAVVRTVPTGTVLDESSWNEEAIAETKEKGKDAPAQIKYRASKTLAEKAAWEWWTARKSELPWDLVALNPPFVFGPTTHEVAKPEELGTSAMMWWNVIVKGSMDNAALATQGMLWVDVRDIAQAHTLALQKEEASGNRFIISAGAAKWQDFVSAAHRYSSKVSAGETSYDPAKATHPLFYNNSRSVKMLGMKYRTVEESAVDTMKDFETKGWL